MQNKLELIAPLQALGLHSPQANEAFRYRNRSPKTISRPSAENGACR